MELHGEEKRIEALREAMRTIIYLGCENHFAEVAKENGSEYASGYVMTEMRLAAEFALQEDRRMRIEDNENNLRLLRK